MSSQLRERGCDHVILERQRVAQRWRSERWDSLCFQFQNSYIRLPGMSYAGDDPDGFAHYSLIIRFLEDYAAHIAAPVREGAEVTSLRRGARDGSYLLGTPDGAIEARNVVIATGPFQRAFVPEFGKNLPPAIYQVDASRYKNPDELPPGAVLVVGSGASGCQIAEELYQCGRTVFLAVSRHRRVPRRYRGKDLVWWFEKLGRFEVAVDSFPERRFPPSSIITGVGGGHDLDIRRFAADGVKVIGHLEGISGGTLAVAENANQILDEADKSCRDFISAADDLAGKQSLSLPPEESLGAPNFEPPAIEEIQALRLRDAGITSVIWAAGYRFSYDWIQLPILDANGSPIQDRGVTSCPGVYFLGLHWMHTFKSGLLPYIGQDAAYLAEHIDARKGH
jgi:putative flavoprotein involved in K+ transport